MGFALANTRNKPHSATPEINITPLVDVVLVLLIIFMVIAPALNEGAQIELPKVMTPDPKSRDMSPIRVLVLNDGAALVNDKPIKQEDLASVLTKAHQDDPGRALLLKSDERTRYQRVRDTFKLIQDIGFKGVLLKVAEKK